MLSIVKAPRKGSPVKKMVLFIVALISAFALASPLTPAFAQQDAAPDQYGVDDPSPAGEGDAVVAGGTVQKAGITTYQYGTHVLIDDSGDLSFALQSDNIALDDYVGERVTLHGTRVPGYQNGAVEGGPDLLEVTRVDDGSPVQPPTDEPDTETDGSGESRPADEDTAATGVLPDTGGVSVAALLAINAVLLGSALLVRRIVG